MKRESGKDEKNVGSVATDIFVNDSCVSSTSSEKILFLCTRINKFVWKNEHKFN